MMSLETIRRMAREAAARAAREGKRPYVVTREDLADWLAQAEAGGLPKLPFPNLGEYRPEGWELVDTYLVDSSGFGAPDEPALTARQLLERLQRGMGYAIIQQGQFQVVVGAFRSTRSQRDRFDAEIGETLSDQPNGQGES